MGRHADQKEDAIDGLGAIVLGGLIETRHISRIDLPTMQLVKDQIVRELLKPEHRWAMKEVGDTPI